MMLKFCSVCGASFISWFAWKKHFAVHFYKGRGHISVVEEGCIING